MCKGIMVRNNVIVTGKKDTKSQKPYIAHPRKVVSYDSDIPIYVQLVQSNFVKLSTFFRVNSRKYDVIPVKHHILKTHRNS